MLSKPMVILISLLCVTSTSVFAEDDIKFTATPNDLTAINACHQNSTELYQKCSTCLKGMPTTGAFLNYSILVHALRKGGLDIPLVLFESPNSERNRLSITNGTATIKGDWDFNIDGNTDVYKSDPFILRGKIVKGVYGLSSNARLHHLKSISDFQKLSAVMNPNWRLDWKILSNLGLLKVEQVSTKGKFFNLIRYRGVDFTLLEFSALEDLSQTQNGIRLVPAPGVKISLPNSQHFMISKKHPQAKQILDAVNRGLAQLHKLGFIDNCIAESGIINPRVDDWIVINPSTEALQASEIVD